MNKKDALDQVKCLIDRLEKMPQHVLLEPINSLDMISILWLIYALHYEDTNQSMEQLLPGDSS